MINPKHPQTADGQDIYLHRWLCVCHPIINEDTGEEVGQTILVLRVIGYCLGKLNVVYGDSGPDGPSSEMSITPIDQVYADWGTCARANGLPDQTYPPSAPMVAVPAGKPTLEQVCADAVQSMRRVAHACKAIEDAMGGRDKLMEKIGLNRPPNPHRKPWPWET